jgi:hypothetical protein
MVHQGVARREMCPLLLGGFEGAGSPPHRQENFGHVGKKQCKIVIFRNFETSPNCNGNRKFTIEHAVTEAMVQSTFVPSFISIEAFFIVS